MNIYARYFDHENVFHSGEEVVDFLININDFRMTPQLSNEIISYAESTMPYPKRIKVKNNIYFILIKTTANDLPEFKANRKDHELSGINPEVARKEAIMDELRTEKAGWYRGEIRFKRVIIIPTTSKCQYNDTTFKAYVYANSPIDCYNLIIDHLKNRQDIDARSQFPSAKGANFIYEYLGDSKPAE